MPVLGNRRYSIGGNYWDRVFDVLVMDARHPPKHLLLMTSREFQSSSPETVFSAKLYPKIEAIFGITIAQELTSFENPSFRQTFVQRCKPGLCFRVRRAISQSPNCRHLVGPVLALGNA